MSSDFFWHFPIGEQATGYCQGCCRWYHIDWLDAKNKLLVNFEMISSHFRPIKKTKKKFKLLFQSQVARLEEGISNEGQLSEFNFLIFITGKF